GTSLTFQFVTRAGSVIDTYTLNTTTPPPNAPTNLAATPVSASRIDLTWLDNSADETGFTIERSLDGVSFTFVASAAADATGYSDTGVSPATKYFYRVRADGNGGTVSAYAGSSPVTTFAATTLIPAGDVWKYLVTPTSTNLGPTWTGIVYDEAG